ncbi:MAG: VWA domain-containing protein [Pseudomonadota bacterium]
MNPQPPPTAGGVGSLLALLAAALEAPGLQLHAQAGANRWRGPLGQAAVLPLQAGQPHRHQRLQLLRRVLDLQAGGRWGPGMADPLAGLARSALLRRLFLWLDGRRVDKLLAQRFPGALADLALDPWPALPAWLASTRPEAEPADALAALQLALQWRRQLRAGRSARQPAPQGRAPGGPQLRIQPTSGPADGQGGAQVGQAGAADGAGSSSRPGGGAAHRPAHTPAAPAQTDVQAATGASTDAAATGPGTAGGPQRAGAGPGSPARGPQTTLHDEWDVRLQAYRRHWAAVHERRLQGSDLQFMAGLHARFPALSRQIRRRFASLHADAPRRERRLRDGDAVDLDAALDALVARRSGPQPADDRLYQARPIRQRSLSVALLLDMSSSTGFPIPDRGGTASPEPLQDDVLWLASGSRLQVDATPRRRVIDVARDAVALLCEALHTLGDRHAVFGFSGAGRLNVDFAVVKDFGDPWSAPQAAALAAVQPQGATRTGAAVRHALRRLQAEPARRKLLIVLSDGYPQDSDYGDGDAAQRLQHGLQDTAQALREAQRAGVSCFNLSVDAAANDYLRRICPKNRYWVVDEVDALPQRMLALVRLLAVAG